MKILPLPGPVTINEIEKPIRIDHVTWEYQHPPRNIWRVTVGWVIIEGTKSELKAFFTAGLDMLNRGNDFGPNEPPEPSCPHCSVVGGGHTQKCIAGPR